MALSKAGWCSLRRPFKRRLVSHVYCKVIKSYPTLKGKWNTWNLTRLLDGRRPFARILYLSFWLSHLLYRLFSASILMVLWLGCTLSGVNTFPHPHPTQFNCPESLYSSLYSIISASSRTTPLQDLWGQLSHPLLSRIQVEKPNFPVSSPFIIHCQLSIYH